MRLLFLAWFCILTLAACDRRPPAPAPTLPTTPSSASAASATTPGATAPLPAPQRVTAASRYRNVPLLGDLDVASFDRTMQSLTQWVSPQAGCGHCHVDGDWASEAKPAKQVARQMLQMVQHLNTNWKPHVGPSGVTCYTCHRGQPQPPVVAMAPTPTLTGAPSDAAQQARAAQGLRLLKDLDHNPLAGATGGKKLVGARCASCHQGAQRPGADGEPQARDHLALNLAPIEPEAGTAPGGLPLHAAAAGDACAAAALVAARSGTRIAAEAGLRPVIGGPALALYAAPDSGCAMLDLHVRPGDTVEAYVNHAGYTSVRYRRAATGSEASGWVFTDRLGPGSSVTLAAAAAARVPASTTPPARGCQAPEAATVAALPVQARRQVLGQGRLQFYSAPDTACPLRGIFILPGEPVLALQQAARFTAVHYVNPRTGGQASGWVLSERLGG